MSANRTLLWTNPSNDITYMIFGAQTISVNLSAYTHVIVDMWLSQYQSDLLQYTTNLVPIDGKAYGCGGVGINSYGRLVVGRYVTANSNSVVFSNGYYANATTYIREYGAQAIPYRIYGVSIS